MICDRPLSYAYSPTVLRNPKLSLNPDLSAVLRNVYINFSFCTPFFELGARVGQTDGRARTLTRPIRTATQ